MNYVTDCDVTIPKFCHQNKAMCAEQNYFEFDRNSTENTTENTTRYVNIVLLKLHKRIV
jgi:hypothetical protein